MILESCKTQHKFFKRDRSFA